MSTQTEHEDNKRTEEGDKEGTDASNNETRTQFYG
jgi:hypothetical protein